MSYIESIFFLNHLLFRSKYIPPRTYSRANTSVAARTPKTIVGLPVAEVEIKPEVKIPIVVEENGNLVFWKKNIFSFNRILLFYLQMMTLKMMHQSLNQNQNILRWQIC